jgi:phosphoribosylglycinamide formyltransferase-1
MKRIGIIASSGGSSFDAAQALLARAGRADFAGVVVDRPCGFQQVAERHGLPCRTVPYEDAASFSARALDVLRDQGADACLLFYTRRVTAPLIGALPVWNLHLSLLPAFTGIKSSRKMVEAGVRMAGATLQLAEETMDSGAILAQVASPVPVGAAERDLLHMGYAHTVYLTLMAAELARLELLHARSAPHGLPMAASACPALPDRALADAFAKWVATHCPSVTFHG